MKITKEITLDVSRLNRFQSIIAKQNDRDSRYLKVSVADEGNVLIIPSSAKVTITATRPDKLSSSFLGKISEDGKAIVPLSPWMLELDGSLSCEVSIITEESVLKTTSFNVDVDPDESSGNTDVTQDPNYDILVELIQEVAGIAAIEKEAISTAVDAYLHEKNIRPLQKGTDYWTEEDKSEIIAELSQIEAPTIVSSVAEMTDTTKHYVLKDTNTIWSFQTVKTTTQPSQKPNFTNLANPNSSQWKNGYRISGSASSSGYVTGLDGYVATNIIGEVAVGDVIRIQGMDLTSNNAKVCMCLGADDVTPGAEGVSTLAQLTSAATVISNTSEGAVFATQKSGYWRFSGVLNGASEDIIITINEEITYTEVPGETISKQEWVDTGISYTPTFKTDLIGVLGEGNVIYLSDNNLPSGTYTLKYSKDDYEAIGTYIVE